MNIKMLRRYAFENGLGLNYISKEEKITLALQQLYILFDDKIILKGGTALSRVYLKDNARFSEDIDLDYINSNPTNAIKDIKEIMKGFSVFDVKKPRLMNYTLRFDCHYINELNHLDKIRLEFFLFHKKIIGETKKQVVPSHIIETSQAVCNVYSIESIIARKLITAYLRTEGKDFYDLFFALETKYLKKKLKKFLQELCIFYNVIYDDLKRGLPKKISELTKDYKKFQNNTNHYLTKKVNISWLGLLESLKDKIKKSGI